MQICSSEDFPQHTDNNTNIKYRYAYDINNSVVDITEVVERGAYTCISCGSELIPVLGDIKAKHFRHKTVGDCSAETYLHKLAKNTFYDVYLECISKSVPFEFEFYTQALCTLCPDKQNSPCKAGKQLATNDLTKRFTQIKLESKDNGYIPDILLINADNPEDKLYVEIAVTHKCSTEKIESGAKIIEIQISCEADIDIIKQCLISVVDPEITTHNIKSPEVKYNVPARCPQRGTHFILYKSGKFFIEYSKSTYSCMTNPGVMHVVHVPMTDSIKTFKETAITYGILKTLGAGIQIRNCNLCAYHCLSYSDCTDYCKLYRSSRLNTNDAIGCSKYRCIREIPINGLYAKKVEDRDKGLYH